MIPVLVLALALSWQLVATVPPPDSAEALEQLRLCVALPGQRAADACRAALKLGLTSRRAATAHTFLAESLWSLIEFEDIGPTLYEAATAERACREAVRLDPDQPLAFYLLGRVLARNGDAAGAKAAYERVVQLRPAWRAAYLEIAALLESPAHDAERTALLARAAAADSGDARAERRPGEAATEGLLLGEYDLLAVRTLWITIGSNQAAVSEVPNDIVVPRPDGFWLARIVHPTPDQLPEDRLWVRRLDSKVRKPRVPHRQLREGEHDQSGCTDQSISISLDFVAPGYIGVNEASESECNGHVNVVDSKDVVRFRPLAIGSDVRADSLSIEAVVGRAGATALEEGAAAAIARAKESGEIDPDYGFEGRRDWTVGRERGQGFLRGRLPYRRGDRDRSFALTVDLPRTLVRQDPLFPSWDIVKDVVPDAVDAFSSPRRDALVVVTHDRLLVYSVSDGRLATRLLVRAREARKPVMVEWAIDRHVARWAETVKRLSARAVPR